MPVSLIPVTGRRNSWYHEHGPSAIMRRIVSAILMLFTVCAVSAQEEAGPGQGDLTAESFPACRDYLKPCEDELRWREIPWRDSFYQALKDSQIEGKPILLWAMNGHPLGCV